MVANTAAASTLDESLLTVSNEPVAHASMDFERLRSEGIKHIEQMASQLWTDYNPHDPGITVLEQLCYAVTDLGFRIEHDMADLLAEGDNDAYQSLWEPQAILPCAPVTLMDLRKLLIDINGVRNAWIEKVDDSSIGFGSRISEDRSHYQIDTFNDEARNEQALKLKGLYRVYIEKENQSTFSSRQVKQAVYKRLHANRNLCEDYEDVQILSNQGIALSATLHIGPLDNPEEALAAVYQAIESYFSPRIRFYSLLEQLDKGLSVDEIIDGPLLHHGFIEDDELDAFKRLTEVRLSDLIRQIMQLDSVIAVEHLAFADPEFLGQWLIAINKGASPSLNISASTFTLVQNQFTLNIDHETANRLYHQNLSSEFQSDNSQSDLSLLNTTPGKNRDVHRYESIQQQMPDIYGVNAHGLPYNSTPERKGQARQLQGYLLFFDQLLANYFSQLGGVRELFSFFGKDDSKGKSASSTSTYFSQVVNDPELNLDSVFVREGEDLQARLQSLTENPSGDESEVYQRKNRFLNHLLARFGMQFTDYSLILFEQQATLDLEDEELAKIDDNWNRAALGRIRDKQRYLQKFPELSSCRGQGFNYLEAMSPKNSSGVEQIIRCKLHIKPGSDEDFVLVEHVLLRPLSQDQAQSTPVLVNTPNADPYSLQITVAFAAYSERFADRDNAVRREFIEREVRDETPAHICIKFLWLSTAEEMATLKATRDQWLAERRRYILTSMGMQASDTKSDTQNPDTPSN